MARPFNVEQAMFSFSAHFHIPSVRSFQMCQLKQGLRFVLRASSVVFLLQVGAVVWGEWEVKRLHFMKKRMRADVRRSGRMLRRYQPEGEKKG
jgi:hypothetical protein